MPIPDYETLMLPVLEYLSDKELHKTREIIENIIERYEISDDEKKQLIPSRRAKLIDNRVGWALSYLRKAGLIESPQRGINSISTTGLSLLNDKPERIDTKFLLQYQGVKDFTKQTTEKLDEEISTDQQHTPEELIGLQHQIINGNLKQELLDVISTMEPSQFEQLVIDLLLAMGYGGSVDDAGAAIGQTNDGGIDGVIKEDVLGLDYIYVQAKRWKGQVPVKEVRDFAGALMSKQSHKGVFITTSNFPDSARQFVSSIDRRIILVDGDKLADLMLQFNLGVSVIDVIQIKSIDSDYFTG